MKSPLRPSVAASKTALLLGAVSLLALGACTTMPTGPNVMALPGSGKSFDQFRADDMECRQYASMQVGGDGSQQAATESGVKSAVVGTAVGALAGAALGGQRGAGVGAGTGLIVGSAAGVGASQASGYGVQRRYDNAYVQCMYAKGNSVPVSQQMGSTPYRARPAQSGPTYAPPPPNYPPPQTLPPQYPAPSYPPPNYPPPPGVAPR